jgi:hypothetical protein
VKAVKWPVVPLIVDGLTVLAAVAAVLTATTDGFDFVALGVPVGVHSPQNPVVIATALLCLRVAAWPNVPLLCVRDWSVDRWDGFLSAWLVALRTRLEVLPRRTAVGWVLVCVAVTTAIKAWNAVAHPGFFSGDDVEIHEMTLGVMFGRDWPISPLRSSFYPLVFIYPGQALARLLGVSDIQSLVAVGRCTVAALSSVTIWLLWRIAYRAHGGSVALLSAFVLSTSHLLIRFGGTELPRPVAAAFVLGAFGAIQRGTASMASTAGALLAVGAAMRFSEVVFVAPLAVQLLVERRWRHAVLCGSAFVATLTAAQVVSDLWFWGEPFHSMKEIVRFTLVERGSTRGYEPVWRYLEIVNSWTDPFIIAAALWATRRKAAWREVIWLWGPILLLSTLPHKEPRYLIPVIPYLSILAGLGVWNLVQSATERGQRSLRTRLLRTALFAGTLGSLAINVGGYQVYRTDAEVALGRELGREPETVGIAVEQLWRLGGRLYLGNRQVVDLESLERPIEAVRDSTVELIVLPADRCDDWSCEERLGRAQWREVTSSVARSAGFRAFAASTQP